MHLETWTDIQTPVKTSTHIFRCPGTHPDMLTPVQISIQMYEHQYMHPILVTLADTGPDVQTCPNTHDDTSQRSECLCRYPEIHVAVWTLIRCPAMSLCVRTTSRYPNATGHLYRLLDTYQYISLNTCQDTCWALTTVRYSKAHSNALDMNIEHLDTV